MSKRRKKKTVRKFSMGAFSKEKYKTFGEKEKKYLNFLRGRAHVNSVKGAISKMVGRGLP